MSRILWLTPQYGYTDGMQLLLDGYLKKAGLNRQSIFFFNPNRKVKDALVRKGERKLVWNPEKKVEFQKAIDDTIATIRPKLVVVNDLASLWLLAGNYLSLNLCRGSIYTYRGLPVLVIDDLKAIHGVTHGGWLLLSDLGKVKRWFEDKQRKEPRFSYSVCKSVDEVEEAVLWLSDSAAIAADIETRNGYITCIGYTGCVAGKVHSYVVPFYNPLMGGNCHWEHEEDERRVWRLIKFLHNTPVIKILQNGATYDAAYLIKYHVPLRNFFIDTMHLFHSIWTEAPKKLNFISSICLDYCKYWKDELKGAKEDALAQTPEGMERYWRYNALDCYNTFLNARVLCSLITAKSMDWALRNYDTEFRNAIGPCLVSSMRGMRVNRDRQRWHRENNLRKHEARWAELRTMTATENFNPFSSDQVAQLVYDVLGAEPVKQRGKFKKSERSTDQKILWEIEDDPKQVQRNPLIPIFIEKILECKKPYNNATKYGDTFIGRDGKPKGLELYNARFMYSLSPAGTETGRLSGKEHPFWCGTNPQNVPSAMREMCVADEGYVMWEIDYSQSDAKFVAFECEDPTYMTNIMADKDTHCVHAAHFFKRPYEEIFEAYLRDEDWVNDSEKGVRQNTKRIVHGTNYQMTEYTMYTVMRRKAVVGALHALGYSDAHLWDKDKICYHLKMYLQEPFHGLYPGLRQWFGRSAQEAVKNGNRATCAFGRTRLFFGDIASNAKIQRELSAYFGQGGTAGNINRSMLDIYYRSGLEDDQCMMLSQTHDSLLGQSPILKFHSHLAKIKEIMERPFEIKGRPLYIKTDAKVGLSWGKGLIKYKPSLTYDDLVRHENTIQAKYEAAKQAA